jgi:hypothetical protein
VRKFSARWASPCARFAICRDQNRVGLIAEVADLSVWEQALQSDQVAEAMKHDRVRPDTIVAMLEG